MRNELDNKILNRIKVAYKKNPINVAYACDHLIDQTGNLLGWVRELAKEDLDVDNRED